MFIGSDERSVLNPECISPQIARQVRNGTARSAGSNAASGP